MAINFNSRSGGAKTVLVAPLDWGLGHTTRCIPIIRNLIDEGFRVLLAGNDAQKALLTVEFPQLPFFPLEGYGVKYGKTRRATIFRLILQVPGIINTIRRENEWLRRLVQQEKIDMVISDNRYGLHHPGMPCYIITHQLNIMPPWGKWGMRFLQNLNYNLLEKFQEIWVPDWADSENNLAGLLSHPQRKPAVPVNYIGPLSRFRKTDIPIEPGRLLIILSGPEPQRSIWEERLLQEIQHYPGKVVLVQGKPDASTKKQITSTKSQITSTKSQAPNSKHQKTSTKSHLPNTKIQNPTSNIQQLSTVNRQPSSVIQHPTSVFPHLPTLELQQEIARAEFVLARCGYSTIMDLMVMQKKAILVPTPGQSEQEYLGKHLSEKKWALVKNEVFDINKVIEEARKFTFSDNRRIKISFQPN